MENRYQLFTSLISKINHNILIIKRKTMSEFNLKSTHVTCLFYLYESNGMTAKELCDACGEDKGLLSRSLNYLEEEGYLTTNSSNSKKYKTTINLTIKGEKIAAKIKEKIDVILKNVNNEVSEEERKFFYDTLIQINNNLEKICKEEND